MLKVKLRRNLIYLFIYFISTFIRDIVNMIIIILFRVALNYTFLYIMVLGEIFGGLSIYLYQCNSKKKQKAIKYFGISLLSNINNQRVKDSIFKKIVLLFFAAFFDIFQFYFGLIYFPVYISRNVYLRLASIQTIASSLICAYALRFKIKKHHKFSLTMLGIFLCLTFVIESLFRANINTLGKFLICHLIVCYYLIIDSFNNCIEKYLVDANYMNPFKILMFEGLFNAFIALIISLIKKNGFSEIIDCYNMLPTKKFILLIFLLFLNFVLSMIVNSYKIYCNVIYSPMARSLINYLMNPLFNIYFYFSKIEFNSNILYFIISEIMSLIVDFFGCIYNEYIIIYCCGLEYETKDAIAERAFNLINAPIIDSSDSDNSTYNINNDDDNDEDDKIKENEKEKDNDNISLEDIDTNFLNVSFENYIF